MTEQDLVDQATALAAQGLGEAASRIFEGDVKLCVKHGLRDLSLHLWQDDARRSLVEAEFSVTITSGVGDLSGVDFDTLLRETMEDGAVFAADSPKELFSDARQYADFLDLDDERLGHYVLVNNRLHVRKGAAGEITKAFKIWACSLLTPGTIKKEIEPEAIQFVAARLIAAHGASSSAGADGA